MAIRFGDDDPRLRDTELEEYEERGWCPKCGQYTMVNYLFELRHEYSRFCTSCGYKV